MDVFRLNAGVFEKRPIRVKTSAIGSYHDDVVRYGIGYLAKLDLVLPEFLFRPLSVFDVGIGSIPSDHLAGFVLQGFYSDEEPAAGSIVAAEARFDFASFPRSY